MKELLAESINILGRFCGKRDLNALTSAELNRVCSIEQADVMVLFGGSILCGGDVLADGIKHQTAKKYIIVGGAGHTTAKLRRKMHHAIPGLNTDRTTEAELFSAYLNYRYDLNADELECNSTNCGNNITFLLDLLKQKKITFRSIILIQDATMQYRMEAGLRKYVPAGTIILNYAAYDAEVIVKNGELAFKNDIWGMWDIEQYITLLMGEIPRLTDDADGYGPMGKDFIAHVDLPEKVQNAFILLKENYGDKIRAADPRYKSPTP